MRAQVVLYLFLFAFLGFGVMEFFVAHKSDYDEQSDYQHSAQTCSDDKGQLGLWRQCLTVCGGQSVEVFVFAALAVADVNCDVERLWSTAQHSIILGLGTLRSKTLCREQPNAALDHTVVCLAVPNLLVRLVIAWFDQVAQVVIGRHSVVRRAMVAAGGGSAAGQGCSACVHAGSGDSAC